MHGHDITAGEIRGELEKILSSSVFSTADRMTRFLRFVVEETLEGRGDNLNEWLLGMAVYDRDRKFDPRVDSIVRVDAGCLRAKLREFYASEGVNNLIGIEIPKGSYKAVFSERMDMKELGRQLGVESFIEGSVRKIKQRIRIMVRLIDAAMGSTL